MLARNKVTNATDETKVTVALEPPTDGRNRYSPEVFSGYDSFDEDHSHHIVKRVSSAYVWMFLFVWVLLYSKSRLLHSERLNPDGG